MSRNPWYYDLIGKEVEFTNEQFYTFKCKVSMIDYHLGLTLQLKKQHSYLLPGTYIYCLNGPLSPKKVPCVKYGRPWQRTMNYIAKELRKGRLHSRRLDDHMYKVGLISKEQLDYKGPHDNPSAASCPFSQ
jgi:hypothetical protein